MYVGNGLRPLLNVMTSHLAMLKGIFHWVDQSCNELLFDWKVFSSSMLWITEYSRVSSAYRLTVHITDWGRLFIYIRERSWSKRSGSGFQERLQVLVVCSITIKVF